MKFKYYLAQPKPGHYEVSIPWLEPLATPILGTSPSELEEKLIFGIMELVHHSLEPKMMHALIPPEQLQIIGVYVDVSYPRPGQMPVAVAGVIQCVLGQWPGQPVTHLWMPGVPDVCLSVKDHETIFETINLWLTDWLEAQGMEDLGSLTPPQASHIAELDFDPGLPASLPSSSQGAMQRGRMRQAHALEQVATNLMHRAADHALPQAYGREALVEELVDLMTSDRAFCVCLVGLPDVGKTTLIEEAVCRVWKVQTAYQERRDFWETSGDRIVAGMSVVGQWEQRVTQMVEELSEREDVLVVDDLLGLIRAGQVYQGDSNVARFIEPWIEQERLSVVAESTPQNFAAARTLAPGFVDRFHILDVSPMDYKSTIHVLHRVVRHIEQNHQGIRTTPDALELMMTVTDRFYRHSAWPGKAVRLAKQCESAALRHLHTDTAGGEVEVDTVLVSEVFRAQTGLPRAILEPGMGRSPSEIARALGGQVFGQAQAVEVCTNLVVLIEQGMGDPDKPLGSLLFVGPSGVGKTEMAKALATQLFGSDERMIRFDMSEFNTPYAISRLIGTARQPDGELTTKVRSQPFCVILLDEIEKADPTIFDLLLQVLGEGRLTDAAGRTTDLRNAVVLMTSNLGARAEQKWMGFQNQDVQEHILHYTRAARDFFKPEFMGRLDAIVPFLPLGQDALRQIAKRALTELLGRRGLRHAQVMVDLDGRLVDRLVEDAIDPRYGARTLARQIERLVIAPLAAQLAERRAHQGLTRVRILPGQDGSAQVRLILEDIARAPRQDISHMPPVTADSLFALSRGLREQPAYDAQKIIESLGVLRTVLATLASRPEVEALRARYQELLRRFNDPQRQQGMKEAGEEVERLRHSEVFLRHLMRTQLRLDALLDPKGEGAVVIPIAQEFDPQRRRAWAKELADLENDIVGLEIQFQSLTSLEQGAGVTVVFDVLSGPSLEVLRFWFKVIRELGEHFELEMELCSRRDHHWKAFEPDDLNHEHTRALACYGNAPGMLAICHAFEGYTWVPQETNSAVADTLMLATVHHHAPSSVLDLPQLLEATKEPAEAMCVEFVLGKQQVEDVQRGKTLTMPERDKEALHRFALMLVMSRVAMQGNVYKQRLESGMYPSLPGRGGES